MAEAFTSEEKPTGGMGAGGRRPSLMDPEPPMGLPCGRFNRRHGGLYGHHHVHRRVLHRGDDRQKA